MGGVAQTHSPLSTPLRNVRIQPGPLADQLISLAFLANVCWESRQTSMARVSPPAIPGRVSRPFCRRIPQGFEDMAVPSGDVEQPVGEARGA
jgi:hypothetical protein